MESMNLLVINFPICLKTLDKYKLKKLQILIYTFLVHKYIGTAR